MACAIGLMATVGNESNEMKPSKRDDMSTHTHTHTAQTIPSVNQNLFLCFSSCDTSAKRGNKRDATAEKRVTPRHRVSHFDPVKHWRAVPTVANSRRCGEIRSTVSLLDRFRVDLLQTDRMKKKKVKDTRGKSKEACTN